MSTSRDLINSSLRLLGVLASGEAAGAAEATDGLASLNDLIDSWSTESLLIPNKVREVFPLISGQQTYTMGTGGNFDTSRPMKIENALVQIPGGSPVTEIPVKILTKDEYVRIVQKTATSSFPQYLYPDNANPLTSLSFWLVPNQSLNVVLYSWKPLAQLANLSTALSLPPGYSRALRYNLAVELAPEYGRTVAQEVAAIASESKAAIKRMNHVPQYLQVDDALRARPATWNWMTGEPS